MKVEPELNLQELAENPESLFDLFTQGKLSPGQLNDLALMVGDTGNERIQAVIMETMRAAGGRAGMMHTLADDVNDSVSARSGSKEVNIGGRTGMPVIENVADLEPATAAIYVHLENSGVPAADLVQALAAGGPHDNLSTFEAMHTLAVDNGLDDVASFTQGAHAFAWGQQNPDGMSVAPILGAQPPEAALDNANKLGLDGETASSTMTLKI